MTWLRQALSTKHNPAKNLTFACTIKIIEKCSTILCDKSQLSTENENGRKKSIVV